MTMINGRYVNIWLERYVKEFLSKFTFSSSDLLKKSPADILKCIVCKSNTSPSSRQCGKGHIICSPCFHAYREKVGLKKELLVCPSTEKKGFCMSMFQLQPQRLDTAPAPYWDFLLNQNQFSFRCSSTNKGCEFTGCGQEMLEHETKCEYGELQINRKKMQGIKINISPKKKRSSRSKVRRRFGRKPKLFYIMDEDEPNSDYENMPVQGVYEISDSD